MNWKSLQAGQLISSLPPAQSTFPSHILDRGIHLGVPYGQVNSILEHVGGMIVVVVVLGVVMVVDIMGQSNSSVPSTQS